ncbi:hypothetical protein [Paenibacillus qinlingensis]|uniref:Lipoprotein with Yx(FWY)xxD motif n=1 Tax=Paenibacillus qinlingensis TaxID=1837343 RepID=A0ABU1NRU1_9BACL|nr:hypothetical protein [Paenibacillus qinlingensis]MDR6550195.1 putative lipoprotein with Yx(FWY)xxD motif [Paenibacillus qinlingensis]
MQIAKKVSAASLILLGIIGVTTAVTASAAEAPKVISETDIVGQLGLLQGEGNGLSTEYLNRSATRLQAAIISLRLQGLEKAALTYQGTNSFQDVSGVSQQNQTILGYLSTHPEAGWQGTSDHMFNPLGPLTAQQFDKVLLEALGYKQGVDFDFVQVTEFAEKHGLTRLANVAAMKNLHLASSMLEALKAMPRNSSKSYADKLVSQGTMEASELELLNKPSLKLMHNEAAGSYLTDEKGMTLYEFSKDVADKNACAAQCLANWPIYGSHDLVVPAEFQATDFSAFTRTDGKEQLTYQGWPLYTFVKDTKPGDTLGNNVNNVWFTIQPSNGGIRIGTKAELGNYFTDANGKALYYYDLDTKGISNCAGKCIEKWPIFYAPSITAPPGVKQADFGTLVRSDGKLQTTYKGYPLYYWVSDKLMGDTTGQDVGHVWYVVDPAKFIGTKATNTSVKTSKSDSLGTYLTDSNGMALYLFAKDKLDPNACVGNCLVNWPIFYDANLTVSSDLIKSDFGVLTRKDGTLQSTYKGWPLYYWIKDQYPGDTTGQNVSKVWFVINPAQQSERS